MFFKETKYKLFGRNLGGRNYEFGNVVCNLTKMTYERSQLEECGHNPRKTWDTIKSITNSKKYKNPLFELLLQKADNSESVINNVNKFFVEVGQSLAN